MNAHELDQIDGLSGADGCAVELSAQQDDTVNAVAAQVEILEGGTGEIGAGEIALNKFGLLDAAFVHRAGIHIAPDELGCHDARLGEIGKPAGRGFDEYVVENAIGQVDAREFAFHDFGTRDRTLTEVDKGQIAPLEETVAEAHAFKHAVAEFAVDKDAAGNIHIRHIKPFHGLVEKMESVDVAFLHICFNQHIQNGFLAVEIHRNLRFLSFHGARPPCVFLPAYYR